MTILAADPKVRWEADAECAKHDPDLWHTTTGWIAWPQIAEARHICLTHCPVREQCHRDIGPMRGAVVGGVFYNSHHGAASETQPMARTCRVCAPHRGALPTPRPQQSTRDPQPVRTTDPQGIGGSVNAENVEGTTV